MNMEGEMSCKKIFAEIFIKDGFAYKTIEATEKITESGDVLEAAQLFESKGADGSIIADLSDEDVAHE